MSDRNWMRCYSLKCGQKGKKGFEIGNVKNADGEPLHISFSIEKCDAETANTAKIQVWNLSPANLKVLDKKNCVVELRAGYENSMALILTGKVETVITTASNADMMTEIEVTDGGVELRNVHVSVSYNKKTNSKTVYEYLAGQMGMSISYGPKLTFKNLPNGFSYVGAAGNALKKLASACGHSWSIQNGIIQVTKKSSEISSRAYQLDSDSGLIGIPKKVSITSSSDNKSQTGYEVVYFLNGAIGVNNIVRLKSRNVNGDFRVYKVTLDGDNMGE